MNHEKREVPRIMGLRPSHLMWLGGLAEVGVFDLFLSKPHDTATDGYRDLKKEHPFIVLLATGITVAHLNGWLPENWDPFHRCLKTVKQRLDPDYLAN